MDPGGQLPKYPLRCVPLLALQELGRIFDTESVTGITIGVLAQTMDKLMGHKLHMSNLHIMQIQEKHKNPTQVILQDASKRGATIDVLQRAIEELGAAAEDILPRYLPDIAAIYAAERNETRPGFPHTCVCQECIQNTRVQQGFEPMNVHNNVNISATHYNLPGRPPTSCNMATYPAPHPNQYRQMPGQSRDVNMNVPGVSTTYGQQEYPPRRHNDYNNYEQFQGHLPPTHFQSGRSTCTFSDNTVLKSSFQNGMNHQQHTVPETIPRPSANQNFPDCATRCDSTTQTRNADSVLKQPYRQHSSHSSNSVDSFPDWIPPEEVEDADDDIAMPIVTYRHDFNNFSEHNGRSAKVANGKDNSQPETGHESMSSVCDTNTSKEHTPGETVCNRNRSNSDSSQSRHNQQSRLRYSDGDGKLHANSIQCTCIQQKPKLPLYPKQDKNKLIFVTFAEHSSRHTSEVLGLCKYLMKEFGFTIKCDMLDELFVQQQLNIYEWIDHYFSSAKFVLICVSKLYAQFTHPETESSGVEPTNNRLHTRYIFDRARSEFINNRSINNRFLPVIFKDTGANTNHLPDFLRSTLHFVYPDPKAFLNKFLKQHMATKPTT